MKLSIVTTLYYSSPYINEFYDRITKEVQKITDNYEIIFVDDGSPDDSLQKVISLYEIDRKVKIIELSRNFGHHKAIMTGLSHAKGEFVFLTDCDLEEDPELLGRFWEELQNSEDIDVVYGVQESRKGDWFERWSGKIFYKLLDSLIDDIKYPTDSLTSRIMTKRYTEQVIIFKEVEYDLWSIFEFTGYNTKSIICKKGYKQSTVYTFKKKMDMSIHIIVSTSQKPLQIIFYMGLLISCSSFMYIIYLFISYIFFDVVAGWTSLATLLIFILGIVIFSIGVLGIYISVIFQETKRKSVIIKNIIEGVVK